MGIQERRRREGGQSGGSEDRRAPDRGEALMGGWIAGPLTHKRESGPAVFHEPNPLHTGVLWGGNCPGTSALSPRRQTRKGCRRGTGEHTASSPLGEQLPPGKRRHIERIASPGIPDLAPSGGRNQNIEPNPNQNAPAAACGKGAKGDQDGHNTSSQETLELFMESLLGSPPQADKRVLAVKSEQVLLPGPVKKEEGKGDTSTDGGCKMCKCQKTHCLKLYCECFASGRYCNGCQCRGCKNNEENKEEVARAREECIRRNPLAFEQKIVTKNSAARRLTHRWGCRCRKSQCRKKYCECFQAGVPCGENCRCIGCLNGKHGPGPDCQDHKTESATPASVAASKSTNKQGMVVWAPSPTSGALREYKLVPADREAQKDQKPTTAGPASAASLPKATPEQEAERETGTPPKSSKAQAVANTETPGGDVQQPEAGMRELEQPLQVSPAALESRPGLQCPPAIWGEDGHLLSDAGDGCLPDMCAHDDDLSREPEAAINWRHDRLALRHAHHIDGQVDLRSTFDKLASPKAPRTGESGGPGADGRRRIHSEGLSEATDFMNRADRRSLRSDTTAVAFPDPDAPPGQEEEAVVVIHSRASGPEAKWLKIEAGRTRIVPGDVRGGNAHFENSNRDFQSWGLT